MTYRYERQAQCALGSYLQRPEVKGCHRPSRELTRSSYWKTLNEIEITEEETEVSEEGGGESDDDEASDDEASGDEASDEEEEEEVAPIPPIWYMKDSALEEVDRLMELGSHPCQRYFFVDAVFDVDIWANPFYGPIRNNPYYGAIWAKSTIDQLVDRGFDVKNAVERYNIKLVDDVNDPLLRELRDHIQNHRV
eukprot:CAMPEP_0185818634 /NCGR_PEP_ID=MMETSP1322-20130828/20966_1 /TAXON_ID=265543 /ORGANISM="Minutocellus polymorphus, Strain RCC2270" /LENGTH=193 /DNA_ID=CAMNT_0028515761 /DNA_START=358 /DNA_END=939 /DNA_ORIENTATION=+